MTKKALKKQIAAARESGDGRMLKIPFSYHRVGRIQTSERWEAERKADARKIAARRKRLEKEGLWKI